MSLSVACVVEHEAWTEAGLDLGALASGAAVAMNAVLPQPLAGGLVAAFCGDEGVRALNCAYRGQDKPTNVLAFPAAPGAGEHLGDVALAFETVAREARERDLALAHHVAHLLVHGFLHLAGYDHLADAEAEVMERLEKEALARMGVADPYEERADE